MFAELGVPIIQFTATPFREDGRRVDGEFIYTYPLKKAQQEGYFKRIRFEAIFGLDRDEADAEIITKVGEILEADLNAGLNHLAMARCQTIARAKSLHDKYLVRYPEYRPILVHSEQPNQARQANLVALRQFASRIIVCVDMLGEGFDLPELKIAALHDHHKSIAVTIQFVGRFTRPDLRLGDATVIANTGMDDLDRALAKLYAEDADWNALVEALSTSNVDRQVRRAEMFKGFVGTLEDIPLQTLDPKMNAFVYLTQCSQWDPLRAEDLYDAGVFLGMKVNQQKRVAVFVTREETNARWTSAHHAVDVTWNLHLLHWDEARNLFFISSSAKGPFDHLAALVCGEDTRRVQGDDVFRSLHRFKRLILRNLGLTHHQGRGVRYSMYMGVDVAEGLDAAKSQARIKNNVFGAGFVDGAPCTRGCSAKGKFWSLAPVRDLTDWVDWCRDIGASVTDPSISGDNVFRGAMRPRLISERPPVPPVAIHWPESLIMQFEERMQIAFGGVATSFTECDIELVGNKALGPLMFRVKDDRHAAVFEVVFAENGARYPQREGPKASLQMGGKIQPLSDFFADDAPQIDFGDGSLLIYSHLYALPDGAVMPPYDPGRIEAWDWSKTNIRRESQGSERHADSIQRLVVERLFEDDGIDIVFDDDGSGEIADVVAIKVGESVISVTLWHCKYSSGDEPGARVKDLYEVCGQAQKSARWRDRPNRMISHMLKREKLRLDRGQSTRFDKGTAAFLRKLKSMWQEYRYEFDVRIVQPGLSRAAIGVEGLHLLAGAETYLLETRAMPLRIIGST
ncbi:MAG: DEAD/DEAH box helicase [Chthoniobacterales bacterium]